MTAPAKQATPIGLAPGAPPQAAGQDAKKYGTSNPVVRGLLDRWTGHVRRIVGAGDEVVVDVGVGEGLCLERIVPDVVSGRARRVVGIEYRTDKVASACARLPGLAGVVGDAGMLPLPDQSADLVTCIEVLEHLVAVEPAVAELARICRGRCVVSVPWEPWFRLGNLGRGKNLGRIGNDPEHVQFFTPRRLELALGGAFRSVRVERAFPWLVAEARV